MPFSIRGDFQLLTAETLEDLREEMNDILLIIYERLDVLAGERGKPETRIDARRARHVNAADGVGENDLTTLRQVRDMITEALAAQVAAGNLPAAELISVIPGAVTLSASKDVAGGLSGGIERGVREERVFDRR